MITANIIILLRGWSIGVLLREQCCPCQMHTIDVQYQPLPQINHILWPALAGGRIVKVILPRSTQAKQQIGYSCIANGAVIRLENGGDSFGRHLRLLAALPTEKPQRGCGAALSYGSVVESQYARRKVRYR